MSRCTECHVLMRPAKHGLERCAGCAALSRAEVEFPQHRDTYRELFDAVKMGKINDEECVIAWLAALRIRKVLAALARVKP